MSQINSRNYQLKLAFQDEDLRKPQHDDIMLWLGQNVGDEAVLRNLTGRSRFKDFSVTVDDQVLSVDGQSVERNTSGYYDLNRAMEEQFPKEDCEAETRIVDLGAPPPPSFKVTQKEWEKPIYGGTRGNLPVGFFDMFVCYETSRYIVKRTKREFRASSHEGGKSPYGSARTKYTLDLVNKTTAWDFVYDQIAIGFEVKTAIRSIGELMRQMQLYRHTWGVHSGWLCVVAPPHSEAQAVLAEHGMKYLECPEHLLSRSS